MIVTPVPKMQLCLLKCSYYPDGDSSSFILSVEVKRRNPDSKIKRSEFVKKTREFNLLGNPYRINATNNRKSGCPNVGILVRSCCGHGNPSIGGNPGGGPAVFLVKSDRFCLNSLQNECSRQKNHVSVVHRSRGCMNLWRNVQRDFVPQGVSKSFRNGGRSSRGNNGGRIYKGKGLSYGGRIPSILQALDDIEDLDEALNPWEASLNLKEISIMFKEQTKWNRALDIFNWLKEKGCYELNIIHYNILLGLLGRSRQWDQIHKLWEELEKKRIVPTNPTYGTLIDSYSKAGLKDEAFVWLDNMRARGMNPDEVTMVIVVQAFKRAREFEKAEQFFKDWCSGEIFATNGCIPQNKSDGKDNCPKEKIYSSYTYNALIDTYGKAGQLQKASDVFNQMLRDGIVPNTITFNTMIHTCGNHGYVAEADALMLKMEDLRCLPDTRTYNILMSLHLKDNNIAMASSYFVKMKASGLKADHVSFRTLLYAFADRGMVEEVESLIQEMDQRGFHIDEFIQTTLMRMYIDAGMLDKSWAWFRRFHLEEEMSSECYSAIMDAYGERGYFMEAEKVFNCCSDRGKLNVTEFNVMIKAYGKAKMYDKACQLFTIMETRGIVADKCTYNSLIQILSAAELPDKARLYISKMQVGGLVDDCVPYCAIISSFVKLGQLEKAEKLFEDMIACGVHLDIVVFGILINAFAEIGSIEHAKRYFYMMKNSGFTGNSIIYNSLIKLYTKLGCLTEAEETYKLLQSLKDGADVYSSNCMIDLYSEHSMVGQAEGIFKGLTCQGIANEFSYSMMLCLYMKIGRFTKATHIAEEMRERHLISKTLSYNNIICLYASCGRFREAVKIFYNMTKSGVLPDDSTFKSLAIVLIKGGVSKEAVGQLKQKISESPLHGTRAWLATLCAMVGMHDEAQQACFVLKRFSETDFTASKSLSFGALPSRRAMKHLNTTLNSEGSSKFWDANQEEYDIDDGEEIHNLNMKLTNSVIPSDDVKEVDKA